MADNMAIQMKNLENRVKALEKENIDLKRKFSNTKRLQDDFQKILIFNHEVKFMKKVYNKNNGVEIN